MKKTNTRISAETGLALDFLQSLLSVGSYDYRESEDNYPGTVTYFSPINNTSTHTKIKFYSDIRQISLERGWINATGKSFSITVKGEAAAKLYGEGKYEDPPPKLEDTKFKRFERAALNHPIPVCIYVGFLTVGSTFSIINEIGQLITTTTRPSQETHSPKLSTPVLNLPAPIETLRPSWLRRQRE